MEDDSIWIIIGGIILALALVGDRVKAIVEIQSQNIIPAEISSQTQGTFLVIGLIFLVYLITKDG